MRRVGPAGRRFVYRCDCSDAHTCQVSNSAHRSFLNCVCVIHQDVDKLTNDESRESPVDPSTNHNHGQDVGQVSLHHVYHHARVCNKQQAQSTAPLTDKNIQIVSAAVR